MLPYPPPPWCWAREGGGYTILLTTHLEYSENARFMPSSGSAGTKDLSIGWALARQGLPTNIEVSLPWGLREGLDDVAILISTHYKGPEEVGVIQPY